MILRFTIFILILFFSALWLPPPIYATECGHLSFFKDFEKNNDVEHHGYYFQPNHCFSVVIPRGIVGRTSSQPSSQHGFGSVLSRKDGGSYLYVGGDYGAWLDDHDDDTPRSLDKIVSYRLSWLQQDNAVITQKKTTKMYLGSLSAVRLTVFYKCIQSRFIFVEDSIFGLDPAGSVYEITLFATDKNYSGGKKVLEAVAKTWKLETTKCDRQ
jgi:Fe-S-cluster formation regulator IscX/YfhJ